MVTLDSEHRTRFINGSDNYLSYILLYLYYGFIKNLKVSYTQIQCEQLTTKHMRTKIYFLVIACLFVFSFLNKGYTQSCNCLPGWQYVTAINISNPNAAAYSDFEVRDSINTLALISAGKMKADGGDIRFTDTQCNPLHYYVERGINTNGTIIWINIPSLPANGTATVYMFYGNPSALSQSTGNKTFAFYEGFDNNTLGRFIDECGSGPYSATFSGGIATFTYDLNHVWRADMLFPLTDVFTVEANVTSVTSRPQYPGLHWAKDINKDEKISLTMFDKVSINRSYFLNEDQEYCRGGFQIIGPEYFAHFPTGIWSLTWVATGSQIAGFPANEGYVTWNATDNVIIKDEPLHLLIGRPVGGTNPTTSISMDWVRARKYAPITPLVVNGNEIYVPETPGNLNSTVLGSTSIRINWVDNSGSEDKFMIERSLDGGTSWTLRDSVPANTSQYTDNGLTPNTEYCYRVYAVNCMGVSPNSNQTCATTTLTGVNITGNEIPKVFNLYQNFPNPFNPVTKIKFDIPKPSFVRITIYDALGRQTIELVNQQLSAGSFTADWNASSFASGIYFYKIEAGDYINEMKMVLLK